MRNAKEFVMAAKDSSVDCFLVEKSDIIKGYNEIQLEIESAPPVEGISSTHFWVCREGKTKQFKLSMCRNDDTEESEFVPGDWVQILYDQILYPGEITAVVNGEYEVNVMHRIGNNYRWPTVSDKIFYCRNNIVAKINPPVPVGHRGQFQFM